MAEANLGPRPSGRDRHHPALLDRRQDCEIGQSDQLVEAHRLTQGNELQHAPARRIESSHAPCNKRHQRRGDRERPVQPPQTPVERQPTLVDRPEDKLTREQRITSARINDATQDTLLHWSVQPRLDKRGDRVVVERTELDPSRARILPQRVHRIRRDSVGANGRQHEHAGAALKMQDQRRRSRIEEVSVIDLEHHRP